MDKKIEGLPKEYRDDVLKAVEILKREGCQGIYLFGSVGRGNLRNNSDIDIAIESCPSGRFFKIFGKLILNLKHEVDLVDISKEKEFGDHLQKTEELVNVG